MSYFEYKFLPAPGDAAPLDGDADGAHDPCGKLASLMRDEGLEDWDFVGTQAQSERRRKFLVLLCDIERKVLVFRRRAASSSRGDRSKGPGAPSSASSVASRTAPRRVQVNVVARIDPERPTLPGQIARKTARQASARI